MAQTYGKLVDGRFVKAPTKIKHNHRWILAPRPETLVSLGYKLLVAEPYPTEELAENEYWAIFYEEDENNIYRRWEKKTFEDEITVNN